MLVYNCIIKSIDSLQVIDLILNID